MEGQTEYKIWIKRRRDRFGKAKNKIVWDQNTVLACSRMYVCMDGWIEIDK
jgi:hypothetical protein